MRDFAVTARYTTRSRAPRAGRRTPVVAAPVWAGGHLFRAGDPIIDFRTVGEAAISGVVVRWREKFNSKRQHRGYLRLLDC